MGQIAVNGTHDAGKLLTDSSFEENSCLCKYRSLVPVVSNKDVTYLNASFQPPMNTRVKAAVDEFFNQAAFEPHPKPIWQQTTQRAREITAEYLHVEPSSLAFTRDTTEGLNLFQRSIKFEPGDNVVVLDTEHPNHVYGWLGLVDQGLEVRRIPPEDKHFADASIFAAHVDERTVAIGLSTIMFHNGQLNDVKDICAEFRPRGIHVLVDMTQHVGVAPIDLNNWNVSAAAFSCHKGLGCPTGLGVLYIDPKALPDLKSIPPIVGAGAIANLPGTLLADPHVQYHSTSQRYEHLNVSLVGTAALKASLSFLMQELGMPRIERHLRSLGRTLALRCKEVGVELVGSPFADRRAPHLYVVRLFDERWKEHFENDGIFVSHYRDGVRVSLGWYNEISDVEKFIDSVSQGLKLGFSK